MERVVECLVGDRLCGCDVPVRGQWSVGAFENRLGEGDELTWTNVHEACQLAGYSSIPKPSATDGAATSMVGASLSPRLVPHSSTVVAR